MRVSKRLSVAGVLAIAGASFFVGAPAFASPGGSYTCTGGEIPSGNYTSLTVAGHCSVPGDAVITVARNVVVQRGAVLDAQSAPAAIYIGGNVTAKSGSTVGLGCQPASLVGNSAHPCTAEGFEEGHSDITVHGNITITDAADVALNGITVDRNVTVTGGDSSGYWSIKNNTVRQNVTVTDVTVAWMGIMFNQVDGNVALTRITVVDEHPGAPGVYVVKNKIGRNLTCTQLTPGVSGGFDPTGVNIVGNNATGQCADLV